MKQHGLTTRMLAEFTGTAGLALLAVSADSWANQLAPGNTALQWAFTSVIVLAPITALLYWLQPISGAHLNPFISLSDWLLERRNGLSVTQMTIYTAMQVGGAIAGTFLATLAFDTAPAEPPGTWHSSVHALAQLAATAALCALALRAAQMPQRLPRALTLSTYLALTPWLTGSAALANPALLIGHSLTEPSTATATLATVVLQLGGCIAAFGLTTSLRPDTAKRIEQTAHQTHQPRRST